MENIDPKNRGSAADFFADEVSADESEKDVHENVNKNVYNVSVNADKSVNKNVYKSVNASKTTDESISLSFSRKPRRRKPVPMTYRLYPETIEKIDDFAMRSGMYVSEFLQAVLDRVLDEIKIE